MDFLDQCICETWNSWGRGSQGISFVFLTFEVGLNRTWFSIFAVTVKFSTHTRKRRYQYNLLNVASPTNLAREFLEVSMGAPLKKTKLATLQRGVKPAKYLTHWRKLWPKEGVSLRKNFLQKSKNDIFLLKIVKKVRFYRLFSAKNLNFFNKVLIYTCWTF